MPEENVKEESGKKGNPFFKVIMIVVLLFVVGGGGFVGWNTFLKGQAEGKGDENPVSRQRGKKKNRDVKMVQPLEPFIVNLMDKQGLGKRYLKVTIELELAGPEMRSIVDQFKPQLKDTILLLLSSQSFQDISTMEGKLELKQALLYRINQLLGDNVVDRIYFTEFVVQ